MSLVRKKLTAKQLAANRQNQQLSRGPVTAEGRERIRAAHLRHGFYSQAEGIALRSLGEDPTKFDELLQGLWQAFGPMGSFQEGLVIRLTRATWLMNRADRMQEGYALRLAHNAGAGRETRLHAQMMRLSMTADSLRWLARSVAHPYYVTSTYDLAVIKTLHEGNEIQEMGEIALALFYQLQVPGTNADGLDRVEQQRKVLIRIKEIFGLYEPDPPEQIGAQGSGQEGESKPEADAAPEAQQAAAALARAKRYPTISETDWTARERPRQLLENILTRQVEDCEAQRNGLLKQVLAGPSPYERAAEIAPTYREALAVRNMQDANFREVRRITKLLMKLKKSDRQSELLEPDDEETSDVLG
jgi:hypothetical protein